MKPNSLLRRLAGNLPGVLLWLAALPLAALGQANYATSREHGQGGRPSQSPRHRHATLSGAVEK